MFSNICPAAYERPYTASSLSPATYNGPRVISILSPATSDGPYATAHATSGELSTALPEPAPWTQTIELFSIGAPPR